MARDLFSKTTDLSDRAGYYLLVGLIGFILLFLDQRTILFYDLRNVLNDFGSRIFVVSSETREKIRSQYLVLQEQSALVEHIKQQEQLNATLKTKILNHTAIKADNQKLRAQLNLKKRQLTSLELAEVISIEYKAFSQTILVNYGATDGAFVGQAVIAENGLVGQVTQVFGTASRVMMIADSRHALPVLLQLSEMQMIAEGTGINGSLVIHNVPNTPKISINETVIASGFGNIFPYGYPVGKVSYIETDKNTSLRQVKIKPFVEIARVKYVFLVFPNVAQNPQEWNRLNIDPQIRVQQ